MATVTVSPKFQVAIPASVRKSLALTPGQKLQVIVYRNRIQMIPLKPMSTMRGFLAGIDTTIERDEDHI